MSTEDLKHAFTDLTTPVKPASDPYARLMKRAQRRRKVRVATWTTALAGGLAMLLLGPVGLQGIAGLTDPRPDQSAPANDGEPLTGWTRAYLDASVRGALATDPEFLHELENRLAAWDFGAMAGYPVRVLFAEDIEDQRVIVAARYSEDRQTGIYLSDAAGSTARELSETEGPDTPSIVIQPLTPYLPFGFMVGAWQDLFMSGVSLAPPGCVIATRPHDSIQWVDSPQGRLVYWPRDAERYLARVTCLNVVRYEGSLTTERYYRTASNLDELIATASAGMRGAARPDLARQTVQHYSAWPKPTGNMRFLYGGPLPGASDFEVLVCALPTEGGLWQVALSSDQGGVALFTAADPSAPDAVLMIDLPTGDNRSLILAPPGSTAVELVDAIGNVVNRADLQDGIGVATWVSIDPTFELRALGADGTRLGGAQFPLHVTWPERPGDPPAVENWG